MKKFNSFLLFFLILTGLCFAQPTENGSVTLYGAGTQIVKIGSSTYNYPGAFAIGKDTLNGTQNIYRTYFEFDLNSFPTGTSISTVTVNYTNGNNGSYTLKLTQVASVSTDMGANWLAIGNGSSLHSGVPYSGSSFNSSPIKTAIQNALSNHKIYIGALSESESTIGSNSSMSINFYITYTYPAPQLTVSVRNDLDGGNGGNIGVAIYPNSPVSQLSAYTFHPYETQKLNLAAYDNQNVNGKNWFFNDTESPNYKSRWYEDKDGYISNTKYTQSITTDALTKSNDDGASFVAELRTNTYTTTGTMTSSETWFTNNTLTGNVTLSSGVTLTIDPGVTVTFNGYYIDPSSGSIDIQNGSTVYLKGGNKYYGLFNSIQAAITNSTSNQTIEVLGSSYTESPSLSSKSNITINGQGPGSTALDGGISVTNSDNITVSGLTMSGHLSANGCDHLNFNDATVTGVTAATVYGGTVNELSYITAENIGASTGFSAYDGTGDIYYSTMTNGDLAVYLTNDASYDIGMSTFCNNGYDLYVQNGAYAFAINNFYSATLPTTIYGNVTIDGGEVCSQRKALAVNNQGPIAQIPPELKVLDEKYLALLRKIHEAKENKTYDAKNYISDYLQLISDYNNLINSGKDKAVTKAALSKVSQLYRGMDDKEGLKNYVTETLASGRIKSLEPYLKRYFIWNFVDGKQLDNALKTADEVISSPDAAEDLQAEMLYEKGLIYKYYLNDNNKSKEMYASILSKFPESPLTLFASNEMGIKPDYSFRNAASELKQNIKATSNELSNYPNPFNPTTVIKYTLKEKDNVTLVVFDILGKEVSRLVDGIQAEGEHSVNFDGSNLPSGIYIYQLKGTSFSINKKMLMIK